MPYKDVAQKVLRKLNRLQGLEDFSLASISKAIEISSKNKIKIILRGQPDFKVSSSFRGAMLTQELKARMVGCDRPVKVYEHFVYFTDKLKPSERHFAIAHELGHVYLHHSQKRRKKDFVEIKIPKSIRPQNTSFFVINFLDSDEMEADMFAAILAEQTPPTVRPDRFVMPCARLLNKLKRKKYIHSKLSGYISNNVPCTGSCSLANNCHSGLGYNKI